MRCLDKVNMKLKLEDIIFWAIIIGIIIVSVWLLYGSPPEVNALITIAIFAATSELLIWKKIFSTDKNTAVSFVNLKRDINKIKSLIKTK